MVCAACQRTNPPENAFCGGCGSPLARVCPGCGRENAPDHNFCGGCGHALKEGAVRRSHPETGTVPLFQGAERHSSAARKEGQSHFSRFSPYTPRHLAEKILTSKSALEGERKQVTVLFADVKGSMDLAEQVDPEEWHRILNRFFEILTDGVHRFEGSVNQYTGDGIMALFGAPITHEDHAHRACYTVLHLRDELRRYAEELKRTRGLTFAVRMGLNSGEVIVGKIGDDLRMDYTAQGHTVGLAARLEQLADPGKAYVSDATAKLVSGYFKLRDLGEFELKGAGRPRHVFELEGVGEIRTRLDVSKARGLSQFVGREGEMATLEQALDSALEGNAQAVGVVAEAGTGKSRLCYEFLEKARAKGIRVREVQCVAHGKSIPLMPVFELLRGFFGITDRDADVEARRKIAGTLLLLDKELTESLPVLFDFLGIPDPAQPPPPMNPEAKRRHIFALSRRTFQARNRQEPGIILIEDLHWMDGGSEQFLENLIEALPGTRSLLLLNFRPEYQPVWAQKSYYRQIPIQPLRPDEIAKLIHHLLGKDASLGDLAERLQVQAAGNPFFIEEAVQSLEESGKLQGLRGAYKLAGPVEEIQIPASVQALLGARIDRLPEREKQLLQTASVVGKEFSERVLREVSALGDAELGESLRALAGAEFIYESALYPELEYAFKHPLTQEVAYRSQLADRRAETHAAVARALMELHAGKLDEHAALLAHHWEHAGNAGEAAQWHMRAAEWAGLRDPGESLRHWRRVIALLEGLPESPETTGLGIMARIRTLNLGWRLGMAIEEAERIFEEGKALATKASNTHALSILHFIFSAAASLAGDSKRGTEYIREALRLAEKAGDPGLVLSGRVNLAFTMLVRANTSEALPLLEDLIAHPPSELSMGIEASGFSPYAQAHFLRSILLGLVGRLEENEAVLPDALEVARRINDMEVLGWAHTGYVYLREYQGKYDDIVDWGRKAVEIAEKTGSNFSRILAYLVLGAAFLRKEEFEASRAQLQHVLDLARESKAGLLMEGRILGYLGEAHLGLGNHAEAERCVREGAELVRGREAKLYEMRILLSVARVLIATHGPKAAAEIDEVIDRGLKDSEKCGTRSVTPLLLEERATLCALRGDEAGRVRDLREARRLFAENGATGHLRRLEEMLAN